MTERDMPLEQRARELLAAMTGLSRSDLDATRDDHRVLQGSAIRAIVAALSTPQPVHEGHKVEEMREAIRRQVIAIHKQFGMYGYDIDRCDIATDTILALVQPQPCPDGGLREALTKCRDQFAFYAREHTSAGKDEKAATNQRFADLADAALNPVRQGEG